MGRGALSGSGYLPSGRAEQWGMKGILGKAVTGGEALLINQPTNTFRWSHKDNNLAVYQKAGQRSIFAGEGCLSWKYFLVWRVNMSGQG